MTLILFFLLFQSRPYRGNPNDDPRMVTQKLVHEHDAKLPKSGELFIPFIPAFKRPPTCTIANKTHPKHAIVAEDTSSVDHIVLKGHAGDTVHYECHSIIAGAKDEED